MSGSELITCLSPLHYSLIRRLLFNNMGLLWPPMLSVKWSFRPFSASGRISVAVSEQSACSAASCSPREMCSMPPFHSVSFYPVSQNSWFSEGGKKNCIAHHFWCIVLAFFRPRRLGMQSPTCHCWCIVLPCNSSMLLLLLRLRRIETFWDPSYTCQN